MTQLQTTPVIAFGLAIAFIVWGKNTQTANFFKREVRPIVRKSMAPDAFNELERKVAKINRPTGGAQFWEPVRIIYVDKAELEQPCKAGECHGEIASIDRSSVDSIIIKEVRQ